MHVSQWLKACPPIWSVHQNPTAATAIESCCGRARSWPEGGRNSGRRPSILARQKTKVFSSQRSHTADELTFPRPSHDTRAESAGLPNVTLTKPRSHRSVIKDHAAFPAVAFRSPRNRCHSGAGRLCCRPVAGRGVRKKNAIKLLQNILPVRPGRSPGSASADRRRQSKRNRFG